jgi:hypothetical protein
MASGALARADAPAARPAWSLHGCGSAGVAYSRHADATCPVQKGRGVGHSGRWRPHIDSRLGLFAGGRRIGQAGAGDRLSGRT